MNNSKFPDWSEHTAVIAASGPSLTDAQLAHVQGKAKVITTNSTWVKAPWADVFYACDYLWHKVYHQAIKAQGLAAKCWTQDRSAAERFQLNFVRQSARPGLGKKDVLQVNGNSGAGAINLAYLFGAKRILLLGFDMREVGGKAHWHPDHPAPLVKKQQFEEWRHKLETVAKDLKAEGVSCINCTPGSALTCFKTSTIQEQLP